MRKPRKEAKIERRGLNSEYAEVLLGMNEAQIAIINALLAQGLHGNSANAVTMRLFNESAVNYLHLVKPQ